MRQRAAAWVLASLVVVAPRADAALSYMHGNLCRPATELSVAVGYNAYGAYNLTTSPQTLYCPVATLSPTAWAGGLATVYDRNPNQAVEVRICDVDGIGSQESCQLATSGTSTWSSYPITLLIPAQGGNNGFTYFRVSLPATHANGTSHLASFYYDD